MSKSPGQFGSLSPSMQPTTIIPAISYNWYDAVVLVALLYGLWSGIRTGLAETGQAPVLLVDDLIDSRWTLSVAGRALRLAGAGEVLPFALAVTA